MYQLVIVLATSMVVGAAHVQDTSKSARTDAGLTGRDLGVWKRFIDTPWKEYGTDGAIQHVLFMLTAPDVVTITVRTDTEVRARVIVRFNGDRTARYCPVRDDKEACDANLVFDDRSVTFTFDDRKRRPEHAVLVNPNMFVHSREIEGVTFDQETYASDAFDHSAAVRQAAHDSMQRYKRGVEEVKRRRAEKSVEPPSK
jgi:D-alanyl-D-alanine carboxypeptidase